MLTWVYRHARKDITQNHTLEESVALLNDLLGVRFSQADCTVSA